MKPPRDLLKFLADSLNNFAGVRISLYLCIVKQKIVNSFFIHKFRLLLVSWLVKIQGPQACEP